MPKWTDEQLNAINKIGTNIIVSAGAGSGKTAVLTQRVITKLQSGIHVNELLILTFTNNAASEMKERIKKEIISSENLKEELKYIDSASITTFDAFALSLIKKYYYYLNLNKDISIIDASIISLKRKEFLDQIFNDLYKNKNSEFIDFITTFGNKNDIEIKNMILKIEQKSDLLIDKEEYLNNYIDTYYNKDNIDSLFQKYLDVLFKRISYLKDCLDNLSYHVDGDYYSKLQNLLLPLFNANDYISILNNLEIKLPNLPRNSSDEAKYFKEQIKKIIDEIKLFVIDNSDDLIQELYKTKNHAQVIINILKELNFKIFAYKCEKNSFEFNDISKFVIKLIENFPEVLEDLKNSYKEIMIDEYQDTSDIQEKFISLIENNNIYMVGDIKQSIYRFRDANPYIFKQKYDLYKNGLKGYKIDLNKNFRSRGEVLENINLIFNRIMDDEMGNANYIEEHQMIFGNSSYNEEGKTSYNNNLEILNYSSDNKFSKDEIEAFLIANDIQKKIKEKHLIFKEGKLKTCTFSDFCILMDRTSSFDIYKKVFDYLKIPLTVYKDENILHNNETYLIKNIISLILRIKNKLFDSNFKLFYTSIARSYLFNISDEEIFLVINSNNFYKTDIYLKCKEISKNLDYMSNKELVEIIIDRFDFYIKMISAGNINHRSIVLDNLLEKMTQLNKVGITIYDLESYFDFLIENNEEIKIVAIINNSNSVTITNIHKSKGLEYNICYYSGLYKRFNLRDSFEKILFSKDYGLIIPTNNSGLKNTFVYTLFKEKYIEEEISEKIRLFYVSLTRCKEKMIFLTSFEDNKIIINNSAGLVNYLIRINYRSFNDIILSIYNSIEKYITNIELPNITNDYKFKKEYTNASNDFEEKIIVNEINFNSEIIANTQFSKSNIKLFSTEEKNNINLGNKIHYILENIDFINPDLSKLSDYEKDIVMSFLNHHVLRDKTQAKIIKEYEFINPSTTKIEKGIIDLLLVYKDHIDIIDYKLKYTDDENYLKQLNGYKLYLRQISNKKINIYLYSLLDKKLIKLD